MALSSFAALTRAASGAESFLMTLVPHGGQGTARRNAWSAMSADAVQSRARRDAEEAVARATARAAARAVHPAAR